MKQINHLTAWWRDLDSNIQSMNTEIRRLRALEKWLLRNTPDYITGKYDFNTIGDSCIRVFIYLKKDEESTLNMLKWLPILKKQGWVIEKFWRKESGYFSYRAQRDFKSYVNYIIFFEETANIDGCVIEEKEVMQKIFVTNCEEERVAL